MAGHLPASSGVLSLTSAIAELQEQNWTDGGACSITGKKTAVSALDPDLSLYVTSSSRRPGQLKSAYTGPAMAPKFLGMASGAVEVGDCVIALVPPIPGFGQHPQIPQRIARVGFQLRFVMGASPTLRQCIA